MIANAQCGSNSIYVNFNKGDNTLNIKTIFAVNFSIDNRLWLSNNQYPKVRPFFLVEIYRGNVKVKPTILDILITPEEGVINSNHSDQDKEIIRAPNEYKFILTTNENKQIFIDKLKNSESITYFDLRKGERYLLYVSLIRNNEVVARSNKIEFTY